MAAAVVHDSPETLISKLKCYGNQSNRIVQDVNNLLRQSNSIASQIGQLVHNDGRSSTLLQLYGTVPIYYKSRQYNIPINIWLVEKYPTHPPTCYVTPTKEMRVKPGHRHVDAMGLVYLPYLNQWNAQTSTLAELVLSMITVFSDDPPVYRADPDVTPPKPAQSYAAKPAAGGGSGGSGSGNAANGWGGASAHASPGSASGASGSGSGSASVSASASPPSASDLAATKKNKLVGQVTTKLQNILRSVYQDTAGEIDQLFEQSSSLRANEQKIKTAIATLKDQQTRLTDRLAVMNARTDELTGWLAEHETKAVVDIDSIVYPKDSYSQQLIDAVAEDHAIEDTLYSLDKALNEERMDGKTFLKQVRKLATQQFFARALSQKLAAKQAELKAAGSGGGGGGPMLAFAKVNA